MHNRITSTMCRNLVTCLALTFTLSGTAVAQAGTLDQSQETAALPAAVEGPDGDSPYWVAQTFTPGFPGRLDRVDLYVGAYFSAVSRPTVTVEIRDVDALGRPGQTVLATASAIAPFAAGWTQFNFATPASVERGVKYAIVASASGTDKAYVFGNNSSDDYSAGRRLVTSGGDLGENAQWQFFDFDAAFRTYVERYDADVSLTASGPQSAKSGSNITYTLTVANAGPETAKHVVLTDRLPYGTQYKGATPSQGTCTPPGRGVEEVTCQLGDIASRGNAAAPLTVKITARPGKGQLTNIASVSSEADDFDMTNNSASVTTSVTK